MRWWMATDKKACVNQPGRHLFNALQEVRALALTGVLADDAGHAATQAMHNVGRHAGDGGWGRALARRSGHDVLCLSLAPAQTEQAK